MASKDKRPDKEHPELHPYAPPEHPDVNVPEQQFEGERQQGKKQKKQDSDRAP